MKPRHLFRICHKNGQLLNGVDTSSHISKRVWDEVVQKRQNDYVIDTTHIQCPFQSTRRIYDSLNRHQPAKHNTLSKSLFIGGDHSMSIATLAYSLKKLYQPHDLKVIWIDAHADINTYEKSETKNLHGTPLAYATLVDVHPLFQNVFTPWYSIRPENILYIGLRDLDSYENELINDLQIKRITCKEINKYPEIVADKVANFTKNSTVHLSLDVDALDPRDFPCTGTPVPNGIHITSLCYMLHSLTVKSWFRNVIGMDIVEANFELHDCKKEKTSVNNLRNIMRSIQ